MKKTDLLLTCLGLLFLGFHCSCSKSPIEEVQPVILKVAPAQVTIGWQSLEPYRGKIFYKPAGTDAKPAPVEESPGESRQHEVTITGLKPGTRYAYRFRDRGKQYQFQTQPPVNKPFSFIMASGNLTEKVLQSVQADVFDFLVVLNLPTGPERSGDRFADLRTSVPLFDLAGTVPLFPQKIDKPTAKPNLTWTLDWGGVRLVFIDDLEKLAGLLDTPAPHTFGIITYPALAEADRLHTALVTHNRKNPTGPASFVFVMGVKNDTVERDGIRYVGVPLGVEDGAAGSGIAIRIDVDVENIRAVFLDEKREIVLRMPPLKGRRTCLECRRLADKGAYQESIKAYKEFIDNNVGHYQIDDAYFAIAEIYDEKLFLFSDALAWYRRLIDEYPSASLTPLARQRTRFLKQYSAHELNLLRRFEQIRKIEFSRKKDRRDEQEGLLNEVERIIENHPDSQLAPVMLHWLANRFRQFSLEKALAAYRKLKEKYPGSDEAKEAAIDIGETYYNAGLYKKALKAYRNALLELPGSAKTINSQIGRAKRNIRRDVLALLSWVLAAILIAAVVLPKPRGLDFSRIGRQILAFVILAILLSFAAWLIHEQFSSTGQWVLFAVLFSFDAALSSLLSTNFAAKAVGSRGRLLRIAVGSLMGIIFFTAGFYLIIYHINVHFLVLFKL